MHVLETPAPLSDLAAAFLARHASRVSVDLGPDDDECRAMMREFLGHSDEEALATLRHIQRRYSGSTYDGPFYGEPIVFEPVFEIDEETRQIGFWLAVVGVSPDGCRSAMALPDGSLWFGLLDVDVPTFPSIDHFLECDVLLAHARSLGRGEVEELADADAHRETMLARHPRLGRLDAASGFCVEWWGDGERLVFYNGLAASLASDGAGTSPVPTVVTTWSVPSPNRSG